MSDLFAEMKSRLDGNPRKIVFPEGLDERILSAVAKLNKDGFVQPVLVGIKEKIEQRAKELQLDITEATILDPSEYSDFDQMVASFVERRKGKATEEDARKILLDENYFGTMLVHMGKADGLVSGAAHSTADTVRPALQIIKTKEGIKKTSGVFIMVRDDEKYVFADCAINIAPDSQDLAEIAVNSAETAKLFNIDPRVALLSFSTKGSAKSPETEKVAEAAEIAKNIAPELVLDGEFQFDAAFVPSVAEKKHQDLFLQERQMFLFSQA